MLLHGCNMRAVARVPDAMFLTRLSLAVLVVLGAGSLFAAAPFKMNFISIVTDDQAAWSVGCYGNKESITPNMDRLAKEDRIRPDMVPLDQRKSGKEQQRVLVRPVWRACGSRWATGGSFFPTAPS